MISLSYLEMAMIEYFRSYKRSEQLDILLAFEDKSIDRLLKFMFFKKKLGKVIDFFKNI